MFAKLLGAVVVMLLAGCASAPALLADTPTTVLLQVQHTPALRALGTVFFECAQRQPGFGLAMEERPASALQPSTRVTLRWGSPGQVTGYTAEIAQERLIIIVPTSSPLNELSRVQLVSIFSGETATWASYLRPACESCPPDSDPPLAGQVVQPFTYSAGEDIQVFFEQTVGVSVERGAAGLVPNPEAMRMAVAAEPGAIGFIPARYLDPSVKEMAIKDLPTEILRQPVLALLPTEPQGLERDWLICLQESTQ